MFLMARTSSSSMFVRWTRLRFEKSRIPGDAREGIEPSDVIALPSIEKTQPQKISSHKTPKRPNEQIQTAGRPAEILPNELVSIGNNLLNMLRNRGVRVMMEIRAHFPDA